MKELGMVKSVKGKNATITIKRHAACGDCGACQVGEEKMTMSTIARNDVNATVGDAVAVEMEFGNVMRATSIAYGIPLIAFILGCTLGYFAAPNLAWDQVLTAFFSGIGMMVVSYFVIMLMDRKGVFGKQYQPIVTEILTGDEAALVMDAATPGKAS